MFGPHRQPVAVKSLAKPSLARHYSYVQLLNMRLKVDCNTHALIVTCIMCAWLQTHPLHAIYLVQWGLCTAELRLGSHWHVSCWPHYWKHMMCEKPMWSWFLLVVNCSVMAYQARAAHCPGHLRPLRWFIAFWESCTFQFISSQTVLKSWSDHGECGLARYRTFGSYWPWLFHLQKCCDQ